MYSGGVCARALCVRVCVHSRACECDVNGGTVSVFVWHSWVSFSPVTSLRKGHEVFAFQPIWPPPLWFADKKFNLYSVA